MGRWLTSVAFRGVVGVSTVGLEGFSGKVVDEGGPLSLMQVLYRTLPHRSLLSAAEVCIIALENPGIACRATALFWRQSSFSLS